MSESFRKQSRSIRLLPTGTAEVAAALVMIFIAVTPAQAQVDTKANSKGRLTSVGDATNQIYQQYDADGRVVATQHVQDGQSRLFRTEYGFPQNPVTTSGPGIVITRETFPDGEQLTYSYDQGGEIVAIRSTRGSVVQDLLRDYRANGRGQVTRIELGNQTVTTYTYNESGDLRLNRLVTVNPSAEAIQDYSYTYDANGNVTSTTDGVRGDQSITLEYDALNQVTAMLARSGISERYAYDALGNLTTKGQREQSYDAGGRPHALADSSGLAHEYDANGNTIRVGAATLEWTAENMARKITTGSMSTEKWHVGEALWKRTEQGVPVYYLPGMRVENGVARKYYGTYAERSDGDGQLRFYHPDHLGSSSVMTDQRGEVIRRVSYYPWGNDREIAPHCDENSAANDGCIENPFTPKLQFNFKEKEGAGFYDYGARLYNPVTGRWLSPDTNLADGPNRYTYVQNNPWSRIDPTGHQTQTTGPKLDPHPCRPAEAGCDPEKTYNNGDEVYVTYSNLDSTSTERLPRFRPVYEPAFECCGLPAIQAGVVSEVADMPSSMGRLRIKIFEDGTVAARRVGGGNGIITFNNPLDPIGLPVTPFGAGRGIAARGANRLLFGPATNRVFWTQGTKEGAEAVAASIGGKTIGETNFGKGVTYLEKFIDPKYTYPLWRGGSRAYASGARGEVRFTFRDPTKPFGPIFLNDEVPRMLNITGSPIPIRVRNQF